MYIQQNSCALMLSSCVSLLLCLWVCAGMSPFRPHYLFSLALDRARKMQRVSKVMKDLALIQRPPAEPLPPPPCTAALAVFMATHWRLGAGSPLMQLDVPLIADILDLYAQLYSKLDGTDKCGDMSPWTCALMSPHQSTAQPSAVVHAYSSHCHESDAPSAPSHLKSPSHASARGRRRARNRVLHLPTTETIQNNEQGSAHTRAPEVRRGCLGAGRRGAGGGEAAASGAACMAAGMAIAASQRRDSVGRSSIADRLHSVRQQIAHVRLAAGGTRGGGVGSGSVIADSRNS
jgi:hypothetical protein